MSQRIEDIIDEASSKQKKEIADAKSDLSKVIDKAESHNQVNDILYAVYGIHKEDYYDLAVIAPSWYPEKIFSEGPMAISFVKDNSAPLLLFYGSIRLKEPLYDLYGIEDTLDLCDYLESHKLNFKMLMLITYDCNNSEEAKFMKKIEDAVSSKKNIMLMKSPNFPIIPIYKYTKIYLRPTKTDGDSLAVREAIQMNCTTVASANAIRPKEVITYSNQEEFKSIVAELINAPKTDKKQEQPDYYKSIKELYDETATHQIL